VLEWFWFSAAPEAGAVGVFIDPGRVGCQVALRRSHLVNSPRHEFPQAHERVWGGGGGVLIVWRGRVTVMEKHIPSAASEGVIGAFHDLVGGECRTQVGGGCGQLGGSM